MRFFRDLIKYLILVFVASIFAFFVVRLTPGDPINMYLELLRIPPTIENKSYLMEKFGLNKSLCVQYIHWIINFFKGDWGNSFYFKLPLKEEFFRCLPFSFIIGMGGIFIATLFSFFLGYAIALKPFGICNKLSRGLTLFSQTTPAFILAIVIIYILSVKFKFFLMFTGSYTPRIILGLSLVALSHIGQLSRVASEHFKYELKKTYMKAYIVNGMSPNQALIQYGSVPTIYGLTSALIEKFSWALGGTAVVEVSLNIPGISNFMVQSIASRDYFVLQTYILVMAIWMFFVHIILNTALHAINRRNFYED